MSGWKSDEKGYETRSGRLIKVAQEGKTSERLKKVARRRSTTEKNQEKEGETYSKKGEKEEKKMEEKQWEGKNKVEEESSKDINAVQVEEEIQIDSECSRLCEEIVKKIEASSGCNKQKEIENGEEFLLEDISGVELTNQSPLCKCNTTR